MNPLKVLYILFLMLLFVHGQSQSGYRACYGFDCKERKWTFGVFAGFSLMGPANDIKAQMTASGFDDVRPGYRGWLGEVEAEYYPKRSAGLSWNVEAGYALSQRSALQLTLGNIHHSTVKGYDRVGSGNYLQLTSNLLSASFNYVWRIGKGSSSLIIGPVMTLYKVGAEDPEDTYDKTSVSSTLKPGFNIGYTLPLVQKRSWHLSFKANYNWLPDVEIGPYTSSHTYAIPIDNPVVYTSAFAKTKVNLSTINFGLSTGWRF